MLPAPANRPGDDGRVAEHGVELQHASRNEVHCDDDPGEGDESQQPVHRAPQKKRRRQHEHCGDCDQQSTERNATKGVPVDDAREIGRDRECDDRQSAHLQGPRRRRPDAAPLPPPEQKQQENVDHHLEQDEDRAQRSLDRIDEDGLVVERQSSRRPADRWSADAAIAPAVHHRRPVDAEVLEDRRSDIGKGHETRTAGRRGFERRPLPEPAAHRNRDAEMSFIGPRRGGRRHDQQELVRSHAAPKIAHQLVGRHQRARAATRRGHRLSRRVPTP